MFLTDAQLRAEIEKCEYCAEKPCKEACPADCSPADFVMAARVAERSDYRRAAALIMGNNPLGGVCGAICPDRHCMAACARRTFDHPVNIPAVQATIVQKAKDLRAMPMFRRAKANGWKVAVIGAGPAGLGAAALLAQKGHAVDIFDVQKKPGGMCLSIPASRLDRKVLASDISWALGLGRIRLRSGKKAASPSSYLTKGYRAVVVAAGLDAPLSLGISGEKAAIAWPVYLADPKKFRVKGRSAAVIGGGAVAVDCAEVAAKNGAAHVELFALETWAEMPLTLRERDAIREAGIEVNGRTRVTRIFARGRRIVGLETLRVELPAGKRFHPKNVVDVRGTAARRPGIDLVIMAIGARSTQRPQSDTPGVFFAGDMMNGPTTVVEAIAAGKNVGLRVDEYLKTGLKLMYGQKETKSYITLPGREMLPVPLDTDFFGTKIVSPFLLSAAPPSDGYDQMKKAYEAGWAGGVMKTAFDSLPIHIPSQYLFAFDKSTYANCDNVSGHPLDRVCREVERLRREWPDRLTIASTGGPVTGHDAADAKVWRSNTKKLERAGACAIEYSLSCPQGGDGTKGDIVSQDAELTGKIVGWVVDAGDPDVPKLFKLTAAVTSIHPIISAIKQVFATHPDKKAGVTLANTFPALAFRKGAKRAWEAGVVVGMSGEGVAPISNLTLANVSRMGVVVSGNGGPMDYRAAANFLALGARTVQFCTIVMKYGYGIVDELHSGLSHMMAERGIRSVGDLIGRALPDPITGFSDLPSLKRISAVDADLCLHCGNCTRCPYLAVSLGKDDVPETDPSRCIGCSICVQKCFSGAMFMRERTKKELLALRED
ncbi:MAG: FAD-dependent oxidoreductase [Deltaproteobacteria bacterium]|nr:FAD-dependent oxidoreductase [Deltaproteobacteria bacterium]